MRSLGEDDSSAEPTSGGAGEWPLFETLDKNSDGVIDTAKYAVAFNQPSSQHQAGASSLDTALGTLSPPKNNFDNFERPKLELAILPPNTPELEERRLFLDGANQFTTPQIWAFVFLPSEQPLGVQPSLLPNP